MVSKTKVGSLNDIYNDVSEALDNMIINDYDLPVTESDIKNTVSEIIDFTDVFIPDEYELVTKCVYMWLSKNKVRVKNIREYKDYINRMPEECLIAAPCPQCTYTLKARKPEGSESWTSLHVCPNCHVITHKTVTKDKISFRDC